MRIRGLAAALVVLVLGACSGTSAPTTSGDQSTTTLPTSSTSSSTTSTSGDQSTTTLPASSTSSSTTSTRPPTTTSAPTVADLPLARPGDPEFRVLFSIPAGPDGITYTGGFEDWEASGPQALTVQSDGSLWIADTSGRKLLHLAPDGSRLGTIDVDAQGVGGLIDLASTEDGIWGLEVVPALDRHRLVFFSNAGQLEESYDLPSGLHLMDGLSGIATTPDGQVWIELQGGANVYSAFDATGAFNPQHASGYEVQGVTLHQRDTEGGVARFDIGNATVERPVRAMGGFTYEGAIPGWIALLLSDVSQDATGAMSVDLQILYADLNGNVAATATYPLAEVASVAYVPQDFIAVGPDGRLMAMKPGPDSLEIIELSLFPTG